MRASTSDSTPTPDPEKFTFGVLYDVMKALEARGFEPFDGHQLVQLQQHLFHFLYGGTDRCYGRSAASVERITDVEAYRAEVARKLAELRQSGAGVDAAAARYDERSGVER